MKQMRCAVCDDLQTERDIIFSLLNTYMDTHGHVAMIDLFSSGEELLASDTSVYDLIILDIFMGEKTGIATAEELMQRMENAKIIFCSTSNEFAAESYEVNALRLTPVCMRKASIASRLLQNGTGKYCRS